MYDKIIRLIGEVFPHGVELGYVDYDDCLTEEQSELYVMGNIEKLCDSVADWEGETKWHGVQWYLEELVSHVRKDNPEFDPDDEWLDCARDALLDLDDSDLLGDLVRNTTTPVTMCQWLIDEDNAQWGLHSVEELLEALGVPDTVDNRATAEDLIANAPTDLGVAFAVYQVSPADLVDVPHGRAAIETKWLPVCYGNPFTGAYYAETFELDKPVTVPLSELTPESNFIQWGPSEVYGEFPYELECETEIIEIDN